MENLQNPVTLTQMMMKSFLPILVLFLFSFSCPGEIIIHANYPGNTIANEDGHQSFLPAGYDGNKRKQAPIVNQIELDKGIFLVASRKLLDPNFSQTVILVTDYNATGTAGLIINKQSDVSISELFSHQGILASLTDNVHLGGPVAMNQIQVLIQSATTPTGARHLFENIFVVESLPLLNRITRGEFIPGKLNVYAGYAGWAAGQLETELLRGDWYLWQADSASVFTKHAQDIWPDLIRLVTARWVLEQGPEKPIFIPASRYNHDHQGDPYHATGEDSYLFVFNEL